jgi:hypothetical protein
LESIALPNPGLVSKGNAAAETLIHYLRYLYNMFTKTIDFWHEKQTTDRLSTAEWTAITRRAEQTVAAYPNYETYEYSFTDAYTKSKEVHEYGICTKYFTPDESDPLSDGKWLVFLAKDIFAEKLQHVIEHLLRYNLISQLKFRNCPIYNAEKPDDIANNFIIITHEQHYRPSSLQRRVLMDLGTQPFFRFDLETKLDMLHINPHLDYNYKNVATQKSWLARMQELRIELREQGITDLHDISRAIERIEETIIELQLH